MLVEVDSAFQVIIGGRRKAGRNREGHDRTFQEGGKTWSDEFESQRLHGVFVFHVFGPAQYCTLRRLEPITFCTDFPRVLIQWQFDGFAVA